MSKRLGTAAGDAAGAGETQYDVVVVGSGGGGMVAALTAAAHGLSVVVVEKAGHFGGSTARSGGGVWIPGNDALRAAGIPDDRAEARKYLHAIIGDVVSDKRIDTYIDRGPEAFSFILAHSPLRMQWVPDYSDYYPEVPGGRVGGRTIEPKPFDGKQLGATLAELEPDYGKAPLNVVVTQADYRWLNLQRRNWRGPLRVMRVGARWAAAKVTRRHLLARGQAFAAALRKGLLDADIPVLLNTPMADLHTEDGAVTGIVTQSGALIRARRGVVLASGGFEHNEEMRKKYQREPIGTEWTVGAKANTGDGIVAGQKLGAATDLMDDAWWGPSIPLTGGPWFCLAERNLPGSIIVNDRGERFLNEALPYVEAVHRMYGGEFGRGEGPAANLPCWMVFDQRYRNRYIFAGLQPRQRIPKRWLEAGVVTQAESIPALAARIGVPADALRSTVERFNGFAATGNDEDFGRGDSGYDRYYADPRNTPNPSLGALEQGPFYAVQMVPGDLGTKGGLRADEAARVLRADGSVIDGLYAVGNTSVPVMGHTYAGPGATIGPAITFAYLAVLDMLSGDSARRGGRGQR